MLIFNAGGLQILPNSVSVRTDGLLRTVSAILCLWGLTGEAVVALVSVGFEPVAPPPCVSDEGHFELVGILHFLKYDTLDDLFFFGYHAEIEFVVHLKDHF